MTPTTENDVTPDFGATSVPEGLPMDARAIRHDGWHLIRWSGAMTVDQLESLRRVLPRLFPGGTPTSVA